MQNQNFSTNVEVGSKVKTNYKTYLESVTYQILSITLTNFTSLSQRALFAALQIALALPDSIILYTNTLSAKNAFPNLAWLRYC